MSRTSRGLCAAGIICLSGFVYGISLHADGPESTPKPANPFAGKVLAVTTKSSVEYGGVIEEASLTEFGNEKFLAGKGVPDEGEDTWYGGRTVWIALSDVSQIVEFSNREEFFKAKEKAEGKSEARNATL